MICNQPSVGVASSEAKQPTGMSENLRSARSTRAVEGQGVQRPARADESARAAVVGEEEAAASALRTVDKGEVARQADASVDEAHVEEAEHGRAAVLDLHDLDEAKRIVHAQRQGDANVTLREHGGADGAHRGLKGRRLERGRLHGKNGDHDYDCEQKGGQTQLGL